MKKPKCKKSQQISKNTFKCVKKAEIRPDRRQENTTKLHQILNAEEELLDRRLIAAADSFFPIKMIIRSLFRGAFIFHFVFLQKAASG